MSAGAGAYAPKATTGGVCEVLTRDVAYLRSLRLDRTLS